MLNMSEQQQEEEEEEEEGSSTEVCLIQESSLCGSVVEEAQKVRMAQGCSLVCVLGRTGGLLVADVTHREALGTTLEGTYSDFSWEEMTVYTGSVSGLRLLAVGSQCELKLFEVEVKRSGSTTLVCLCQCPAGSLVQMLKDKDLSVCEPVSIRMLCFVDGRCCLLLNDSSLLWLKWEQGAGDDPQPLSCCHLPLPSPACQYRLCRGTLFVLSTNGVIYVFDSVDGRQLAMVNLPLYMSSGLEEEEQTSSPCPSSFCVLQVSADLSTVVAVSLSHEAVAVDLNHYFRTFPDHLLCRVTSGRPSMQPPDPRDQDSMLSSTWSHHALGTAFTSDRSWEARLSSMYNRAKAGAVSQPPISVPQPWFSDLPHPECLQALSSARLCQSRAPPGGAAVSLSIPDSASLSLLSVSEFSAVLTYVSSNSGEHQATVALWDLQSQSVSYHRANCQAVPVQRCGEQQHSLLLKGSGLVQVLFGVTQEELLNRLMVFGSAATVDALCHLNSWGRCSIPLHALQAGLKNRQLDTVDFFLKSKENILNPAGSSVSDGDTPSQLSTIQELCPALDLLCSSIRDSHNEAQSRQFSEQLLSLTLSFLNTQVTTILNNTQVLDADSERCVEILDAYITELRVYMKKFPWTAGSDIHTPASPQQQEEGRKEEGWDLLTTEALVQKAVLTNQIPRVQAFLQRQGRPDRTISDLRCTGLRLVFNCLSNRDLQQAKTLLRNMGFNVKKQLHSVCLYTDDKDLREFVVEELATQGYLSEEEMQRVAFLRQMQVLGSQPTTRCSRLTHTTRVLQLAQSDPGCRVVLEGVMGDSRSQSDPADLWSSLRLDWVRHWDHNSQRTVQLSRVQDTAVASSDPVVLWGYLTSLHDRDRLVCWIQSAVGQDTQPSDAPCWPELTSDLVNNNTHCSRTLREHILHLLARRGMLTKAELSDFDQLLWRMSQAGGVMTAGTPLPPNLHKRFIQFCLDHSLQYLLYTYLQYYRLTPRNCPSLSNRTLSENQPWFDMLVKTQEISRDLTDPECVFWTSLTSAQVVLPGGQASVSSMLLEGHSLLALATIMFTPGGIDQVLRQGDGSGSPAWRVDPQLLKMTLTPYPKLRAALFPAGGPRSNPTTSDLSIYHLMQSLHPLDPSRLFVWQTANTLSPNDVSELPHFSSPDLVNRFALMERLDAAYYLRHGRPASAYVTFLLQNLPGCSDVTMLLCAAAEQAYHVALQSFNVPSVASACVCFCELLGVCSLKLRMDLRVLIMILHHWTHSYTLISPATHTQNLVAKGNGLLEVEQTAAEELIGYLESAVIDSLEHRGISRTSYEAGQEWAVPVQFCQLHHLPITSVYPAHCAADGHWINFLLFVQLHSYPPQQVRLLATQFGPALQAHLSLAFQELQFNSRQCGVREDEEDEEQEESVKAEVPEPGPGPEPPRELFQVLLRSQEEPRSWTHLLGEALAQRCPLLAILAACYQEAELLQCLCVWLLSSVDDVTATEATAHLEESWRHHSWSLHDLSIIWRVLLGRGHVRPLLRGFQLFQKDCVLVHVLQMFELCSDHKNFSQAKDKLLDFQRSLVALRSSVCVVPGGLPVQWVESQASVLLMTMLQRCATRYELHRLLVLLAGMDGLLKSNGPDFKKLSQLSEVLQAGPVCVSSRLLQPCSQQELQTEYQGLVDSLQAAGLFPQARQVAELAALPVDSLLINQLHQELITQKGKRHWGRREARVCFWRRCHEQFETNGTRPEPAAQFFWSQTEVDNTTPHISSNQTELLRTQERRVLLSLAGHWLSRVDPVPLPRLRLLEKCLWTNRIQERVLLRVSMETEGMFSLPFPPLSPVGSEEADSSAFSSLSSWYEVLVNEQFCFSKISALNQESDLTLDDLPQEEAANHDSAGNSEEQEVLSDLIGQLLDEGRVHEASRVCRYFSYYHSDMRVVLRCRGLASGELQPETQEVTEAQAGRSLTTSPSVSTLLSFDFTYSPPTDDQVLCQLKTLVNSCRHGSNYCKQVLSLYELSKELDCSFSDLYKEDPQAVLSQVLMSSQPERYQKAQAFIKVQNLQPNTVAQLVANATVQGILASTQDTLTVERQVYRPSEGRESFVQLAKLCGDPNLVGLSLLDLLSTVPLSKLDCIVEVLIVVHDCFSLSCNMEGIVRVLQAARHLSHAHLAPSEQYGLLVRLLTGIGRYNDMTYIFDLLHQNHRFEILLRKNVDRPPGQSSSLKAALLDYIKRCLPGDSEKHNMVALCFSMRREIGENHEMAARTQLKIIESQPWVVTPELEKSLSKVFDLLKDAAESYSKDQCVRQATRCVRMAKLVLLQSHFLKEGSQQRIVNLHQAELAIATLALPRCYQVFVVSEAYDYSPDWAELVYQKVLVHGDFQYLEELKRHRPLTSSLFEDVSKKWTLSRPAGASSQNLRRFLRFCDDVSTLYRLAYQHQLTDLANLLLQDCKSSSYLTDRLAN